jgi:hypothetical protein
MADDAIGRKKLTAPVSYATAARTIRVLQRVQVCAPPSQVAGHRRACGEGRPDDQKAARLRYGEIEIAYKAQPLSLAPKP